MGWLQDSLLKLSGHKCPEVKEVFRKTEGSTFTINTKLLDATNAPRVPQTLRYKIDCLTTGREVLAWTSLAPSSDVTIQHLTALISRGNAVERKALTLEADAGLPSVYQDDFEFEVRRLPNQ